MSNDPFRHDDAAYVMGRMSEIERRAFERHLLGCADCSARVAEIADMPTLLGTLSESDLALLAADEPAPPLPETLLPALLRTARGERRRRGWLIGSVASAAAAVIVTLAVALVGPSGGADPQAQAMTKLTSRPMHASIALKSTAWGTKISLTCSYDITDYASPEGEYQLVIVDRSGVSRVAGSWKLESDHATHFVTGSAVPTSQIARVDVTLPSGEPVLQYTPGA
jgi:hypothetical protein